MCYVLHALCCHFHYSLPDVLRMNGFTLAVHLEYEHTYIQEAIKSAPIFMLVLSKEALARCKNEGDWVRREIQLAISLKKHIIPINPDNTFDGIPEDIP